MRFSRPKTHAHGRASFSVPTRLFYPSPFPFSRAESPNLLSFRSALARSSYPARRARALSLSRSHSFSFSLFSALLLLFITLSSLSCPVPVGSPPSPFLSPYPGEGSRTSSSSSSSSPVASSPLPLHSSPFLPPRALTLFLFFSPSF